METTTPETIHGDHLRLATIGDVPRLEALIARSIRELGPPHYTSDQIEPALAHLLGVDRQLIDDRTYFLVERDEQVVAAGGWSFRAKSCGRSGLAMNVIPPRLNPVVAPAIVRNLFVHPAHARRGLGRRLLRASEAAAALAGFSSVELVALLPALAFYRACGYVVLDRSEVQFPDGSGLPVVWMHKAELGK
jgi:GNAT superfamily N-acetyltransferase